MSELLGNELFRSERLYLSAIEPEHRKIYAEWLQNLAVLENIQARHLLPRSEDFEEQLDASRPDDIYSFNVCLKPTDEIIGNVMVHSPNWRSRNAEVGIMIGDPKHWNQGYGTEAMQIIVRYAFLELNMYRVGLTVNETNLGGIRSYEKIGFQKEVQKRDFNYHNGRYIDLIIMSILRDEWLEKYWR